MYCRFSGATPVRDMASDSVTKPTSCHENGSAARRERAAERERVSKMEITVADIVLDQDSY